MPSTYSDLKIELIATGEQSGTWGTTTNTNLGTAIEEAITGSANVAFSSGDVTISLTNTNASQTARNLRLNLTGTSGGARTLTVPAIEKQYIINNGLADACTVKNSTGTGIAVPAGKTMVLFNDGTNVVESTSHLGSLTLGTDLAVADGGTGASDAATARTNLGLGTMATQSSSSVGISGGAITGLSNLTTSSFTASGTANFTGELQLNASAGTSGQVLTSQGSGVDPIWSTSFLSGMLMMWTTGTAPSGWLLCNGSAISRTTYSALFAVIGTTFGSGDGSTTFNLPDYRDRMPIGAGTTYSIAGTGGSKDAIVVSHTHTVSGTTATGGSHSHDIQGQDNNAAPNGLCGELGNVENYGYGCATRSTSTHSGHTHTFSATTSSAGSSGTNANLPPYIGIQFIIKT
jgi:microcystin-dependent protein/two-component sensor histidine kinase